MATETREVTVLTCDGCGREEVLNPYDDMPLGWYTGGVLYHHAGGGDGGEWHACRPAHIKAAVLAAVESNDG